MITFLSILFIIICFLLIFMVVITPSSEGGMAAAFGGMGSETFFGTKAGSHINKFTVFLAVSFLLLAVAINRYNTGSERAGPRDTTEEGIIDRNAPAPVPVPPTPPPAPTAPEGGGN